ncbi:hypothetical protein QBC32DRAFT_405776 [Pseudoneurospora amorphoporcata]|uniref:Uncharacterized protein n=1 Tax=Pseudoneurospora amorphoporcata TaxID=241081 RepID=A0AAN6NYA5_9PEZI|nr:hypothetical protein QBC32DRAFT_405776 [Pseudoneurospora amorphoporcata]
MPARYKQTARMSTGGMILRCMQPSQRAAFESDIAKFREHTDDSDVESRPEGAKDFGTKASLTLAESRLRGTAIRPSHRPLPISHMMGSNQWKRSTDSAVIKSEVKPKEEKPSLADQKHKILSNLGVLLEVRLTVALAAFFLCVLRCLAVLESRIASAEASLEKLSTESSGNNGHFFLHFSLEVLLIAGLATFCVWVLRRLADLESRITA